MRLLVGTSGFSYDGWKESFYPVGLPARERLAFYAGKLSAVEINNTFYRMPKKEVVESWAAQVPEHFRFSVKASRRITHQKRLSEVDEEVGFLLGQLAGLGPHLGVVLFQTPPNLRADTERLARFLDLLPQDVPVAFEPRHPSFWEDGPLDLLRTHGRALVHADAESEGDAARGSGAGEAESALVSTADFGYLRLRKQGYDEAALRDWALRIRAQAWQQVFLFFKHEDEGAAPALAARFEALFDTARMAPARREARAGSEKREAG